MNLWNLKARIYHNVRNLPGFSHLLREEMGNLAHLIHGMALPDIILDIGTGTGTVCRLFKGKTILGMDASINMLYKARTLNRKLVCVQARAEALPIRSRSVAFVSVIGVTEYIADVDSFLNGINCTLIPGSMILITMAQKSPLNRLRLFWGAKLYLRSRAQWDASLPSKWQLKKWKQSLLQTQFLYQKQN